MHKHVYIFTSPWLTNCQKINIIIVYLKVYTYCIRGIIMCKFIGVEILAANALIEALDNEIGKSVSFSKLDEYGIKVIRFLECTFNEQAVILYNENYYGNRFLNCTKYFNVYEDSIVVKDGITASDLRKKFRAPLTYEILKAVLSEEARNVIVSA